MCNRQRLRTLYRTGDVSRAGGIGGVGGWIDNHILFRLARSGDCHTTNRHGIARMMEKAGFTVTESRQIQGMIYTVTGRKRAK